MLLVYVFIASKCSYAHAATLYPKAFIHLTLSRSPTASICSHERRNSGSDMASLSLCVTDRPAV